jgi:phage shock protein A
MGIFDRLSTLIKSNINDLISSAENPEKMLNQIIVDMRNQLAKAKQQVAAAIADEKRLQGPGRGRVQARRRLGEARHARRAGGARRPRQAGAAAQQEHLEHASARDHVGAHRTKPRSSSSRCVTSTTRSKRPSARRTSCWRVSVGPRRSSASRRRCRGCRRTRRSRRSTAWKRRSRTNERQLRPRRRSTRSSAATSWPSEFKQLERARAAPAPTCSCGAQAAHGHAVGRVVGAAAAGGRERPSRQPQPAGSKPTGEST